MIFTSTMTLFLLVAFCPKHHYVEIEKSVVTGAVGLYDLNAVSIGEALALEPQREILLAVETDGFVIRKCPRCKRLLKFRPIKAYHMTSPHKKGNLVWEKSLSP